MTGPKGPDGGVVLGEARVVVVDAGVRVPDDDPFPMEPVCPQNRPIVAGDVGLHDPAHLVHPPLGRAEGLEPLEAGQAQGIGHKR